MFTCTNTCVRSHTRELLADVCICLHPVSPHALLLSGLWCSVDEISMAVTKTPWRAPTSSSLRGPQSTHHLYLPADNGPRELKGHRVPRPGEHSAGR